MRVEIRTRFIVFSRYTTQNTHDIGSSSLCFASYTFFECKGSTNIIRIRFCSNASSHWCGTRLWVLSLISVLQRWRWMRSVDAAFAPLVPHTSFVAPRECCFCYRFVCRPFSFALSPFLTHTLREFVFSSRAVLAGVHTHIRILLFVSSWFAWTGDKEHRARCEWIEMKDSKIINRRINDENWVDFIIIK